MENKEVKNVPDIPYLAFESSQARMERVNMGLLIIILVLIVALIGTNAAWIQYENQFVDTIKVEQEVDTESAPAYVNATGEMTINGESETNGN